MRCPSGYSVFLSNIKPARFDQAANSIEFYSSASSSSTYFSKSEFKVEFSNLIIYEFEFDKNKLF